MTTLSVQKELKELYKLDLITVEDWLGALNAMDDYQGDFSSMKVAEAADMFIMLARANNEN
jgi:hypothetical protein